jgi:phage tail sheath protein FI
MPEYLSPGVYVEEVSYRAKSIEGLGTTTTGFVGPTRYGPLDLPLGVITSIGEFERIYGDRQQMQFGPSPTHNYMWHAARAFFEEGGTKLYISRIFVPLDADDGADRADGTARETIGGSVLVQARFPGDFGNMPVRVMLKVGGNVLGQDKVGTGAGAVKVNRARGVLDNDVVLLQFRSALDSPLNTIGSPPGDVYAIAQSFFDTGSGQQSMRFTDDLGGKYLLSDMVWDPDPDKADNIKVVTATITVYPTDPLLPTWSYSGLALDSNHKLNGSADSIEAQFAEDPSSLGDAQSLPIIVTTTGIDTGLAILDAFFTEKPELKGTLVDPLSTDVDRSINIVLAGGNDGKLPDGTSYEGISDPSSKNKTALTSFEDIDEISIVAAPGSTFGYNDNPARGATVFGLLISHCERMRYRIAVLDSGENQSITDVSALRAQLDSTYAALYYPWVTILDPVTRNEINLPPSGFVAGIYARNDVNRAVYKAPANEVVTLALGFEFILNKAQQDALNPLGINCFRFFEGRGYRLWGARTISSDPEWKYVNLRRYFAYLEHSIDKGTQWAVFEPNGPLLWANVRRTISDFLLNEWTNGALLGDKPETSYFVRCDRSTMTQNDLDNGRLVCLIGVAALRPAEFVIFRIGQWTADHN